MVNIEACVTHRHKEFATIGGLSVLWLLLVAAGSGSTPAPTSSAPYSQTDLVVGTGAQTGVDRRTTVF